MERLVCPYRHARGVLWYGVNPDKDNELPRSKLRGINQ